MKLAKDLTNVRTNNAPVKVNFRPTGGWMHDA